MTTGTRSRLTLVVGLLIAVAGAFTPPTIFSSRTKVSTFSSTTTTTSLYLQGHPRPCNERRTVSSSHGTTATTPSTELLQQQSGSSSVDPEDVLPLASSTMTPEGYGFSSPIHRILKLSTSHGQYYKASASDCVTKVMDGITNGVMSSNAALVFADDDDKTLVGIFTETDYIKVSTNIKGVWTNQSTCIDGVQSSRHPDTFSLFLMLFSTSIRNAEYNT